MRVGRQSPTRNSAPVSTPGHTGPGATGRISLIELGAVYRETRLRLSELLAALEPSQAEQRVPCCPDWTIKDLAAHVAGVCADIREGRLEGVTTEPWTAAQIAARRSHSLDHILDEWSEVAPGIEELAANFPRFAAEQWVTDIASHEHDVRGALDEPRARDSAATKVAVDFIARGFVHSVDGHGLPPLVVSAGDRQWRTGDDEPAATLTAEPFELLRSLTGRRSSNQIRALRWDGDPDPYLPALRWGPFTPAARDIVE
jgi:uncharacterized protein (TIGR03083 family)